VALLVLPRLAGVDQQRVGLDRRFDCLAADQHRLGGPFEGVLDGFDRCRLGRRPVGAPPRAVVAVEQVELRPIVAVELGGHEESRGEHAVGVIVRHDRVVALDSRLTEEGGEGLLAGQHSLVAVGCAKRIEGNIDRTGHMADPLELPRLAHVDDPHVLAPVEPLGGHHHIGHVGTTHPDGLNPAIRRCDSQPVVRSGGGSIPFSAERVRRSRVGDTSENCLFFPRDNWGECGR